MSRKTYRRELKLPRLSRVSASVSEATTSRLGLVLVSTQKISCTSLRILGI